MDTTLTGEAPARRLSIIVPCLNEGRSIAGVLGALSPLRARGAEVIVVDGGSSDGTPALAAAHADRLLCAPPGRASQMNLGAAHASGDVLMFLHADTNLPPDADRLVEDALAPPGRSWGRFDVEIEGAHPLLRVIGAAMNLRSRWTGIATGDQAMFMTRELFTAVGGFPPIALMEDVALSARLRRQSRPVCVRERASTSGRRWEQHGVVRTVLLMWWLRLAYFFGADPKVLARRYAARD